MTKKTNSLLLRLGSNILWKNKSVNIKIFQNILQLEYILYKELKKKNLKILFIKYKNKLILIFAYNFLNENINLKFKIVKYFSKNLNFRKTIQHFNISKNYIKWFLKNVKIKKKTNLKKVQRSFFKNIILLFLNKYYISNIIKKIKIYQFFIFNKFFWIFNCFYFLTNIIILPKNIFNIKTKNIKLKLKKINGLIKFKIFSIFLENIIFKYCNIFLSIKINNIKFKKNLLFNVNIYRKYNNSDFTYTFNTIVLAILYKKAKVISEYLVVLIKKNKNHQKILNNFILILEKIFFLNIIKLKGFKIRLSGKLNGKMRKSKFQYKLGKVQLQILNIFLNFNINISYTKFGTISIKTWIINGNY